jgi:four helix bundle protein
MAHSLPDNPVLKFSFDFAISVLKLTDELESNRKYTISKQLSRSGTSIGANVFEAQSCESRADFIHKMKIAAKEAEETKYWLMICLEMDYIQDRKLLDELEVICKLLGKIISTSKSKSIISTFTH